MKTAALTDPERLQHVRDDELACLHGWEDAGANKHADHSQTNAEKRHLVGRGIQAVIQVVTSLPLEPAACHELPNQ